jgi:hypothetical protein
MIKPYWETSEWLDNTPNHVYFLDDSKSKMYAYVIQGDDEVTKVFKKPIRFDSRHRKFVEVPNIWRAEFEEVKLQGLTLQEPSWEFEGSKGAKYTVTLSQGTYNCTCPGFTYRGKCKHVDSFNKDTV